MVMGDRLQELGEELQKLMAEESASLKSRTFRPASPQELRSQTKRLNRIREVSADLLMLLKSESKGSNPTS
jgi:hypothetical protein